jgi:hypothetical protein
MDDPVYVQAAGAEVMCFREALEALEGEAAVRRALEGFSAETRAQLDELTPMSRVPVRLFTDLADAVARGAHKSSDAVLERAAHRGAERNLRSFFGAFLVFNTDEALLTRAPIIYARLRDTGHLTGRQVADRDAELRLTGWPDMDRRQIVLLAIFFETLLTLAGRLGPLCRWEATDDGALFRLTWS